MAKSAATNCASAAQLASTIYVSRCSVDRRYLTQYSPIPGVKAMLPLYAVFHGPAMATIPPSPFKFLPRSDDKREKIRPEEAHCVRSADAVAEEIPCAGAARSLPLAIWKSL